MPPFFWGKKDQTIEISSYLFLVAIIFSYGIAIVEMGIWTLLIKSMKKCNLIFLKDTDRRWIAVKATLKLDIEKAGCNLGCSNNTPKDIPSIAYIYDYIRLAAPEVGSRLVKIRAECHMCAVLIMGFAIIAIWNIVNVVLRPTRSMFFIEFGIVVATIACWSFMRDLEERLMAGLGNYWALLMSQAATEQDNNQLKSNEITNTSS